MPDDTNLAQRRNLLTTALVGALLPKDVPEGHMIRAWLDSWSGIGHVTVGWRARGSERKVRAVAVLPSARFQGRKIRGNRATHNRRDQRAHP